MKKTLSIWLCLLMLISLLGALPVSAAKGSMSLSASKTTAMVGDTVTVTASYSSSGDGIGSLDATFHYNSKAFEYLSCSGATASGGAGNIKMSYFCTEATAPKKVTVSISLKAIAPGSGNFKWETEGMYSDLDDLLGTPAGSLSVSVTNPTESGDATLKTLVPNNGTLSPSFNKNITEYTVKVPYSVTTCLLRYDTTDPNAQTSIAGSANLKVGKNTRAVTVTAPNGNTKTYTVVITREEAPSTSSTTSTTNTDTSTSSTTTTAPITPPEDALEVEVDGKAMLVASDLPATALPANYTWDFVKLGDGIDVPAAKHEKGDLTLLYLMEKEGDAAGFYYYDAEADTFAPYHELKLPAAVYSVHSVSEEDTAPAGTVTGPFDYEGMVVTAYLYEDPALADFAILKATTPEGVTGLYVFDSAEKTFQRYTAAASMEKDPAHQENTTATKSPAAIEVDGSAEKQSGFAAFMATYQHVFLIGAAVIAALGLLIIGIVLVAKTSGNSKGKH